MPPAANCILKQRTQFLLLSLLVHGAPPPSLSSLSSSHWCRRTGVVWYMHVDTIRLLINWFDYLMLAPCTTMFIGAWGYVLEVRALVAHVCK